jgi:3-hydroxyanthranilate 3,4-dioxygenase
MGELKIVNLPAMLDAIRAAGRPNSILWQEADSLAFVARGREYRSEFHVDPSDEIMYMVKGDMALHHITPDGKRQVTMLRQGEIMHCPAGTPHSPRFAPDSLVLVIERKRKAGEKDRFLWFCEACDAKLFETERHVADYREDPVSRAYEEFYGSEQHRTCKACGHVTPVPPRK